MQGLANNRYDEIPPHKVKKHFKKSIAKKKKKKISRIYQSKKKGRISKDMIKTGKIMNGKENAS